MNWIKRYYENDLLNDSVKGKITVIYGPRQVGKTSLVNKALEKTSLKIFRGSGEDFDLRDILESQRLSVLKNAFSGYDILFIDEAQFVRKIGLILKLIIDSMPKLRVIATGSSSFELSGMISEPLTGRMNVKFLFPISILELNNCHGGAFILQQLENLLIYGLYPEVLNTGKKEEKIDILHSFRDSYLFKDILALENIRNPEKLISLLRLIAFQIGSEVSLNELSNSLNIANKTVERYLDLLEKTFVIKKISGFSRNLRSEVTKTCRYYFWDNGIRNSVINNFNMINARNDIGALWENFLVMERLKKQNYMKIYSNNYFWRTYNKSEVDFVEERDGRLFGYEFKWGKKVPKAPKKWVETYENSEYIVINKDNFFDFVT